MWGRTNQKNLQQLQQQQQPPLSFPFTDIEKENAPSTTTLPLPSACSQSSLPLSSAITSFTQLKQLFQGTQPIQSNSVNANNSSLNNTSKASRVFGKVLTNQFRQPQPPMLYQQSNDSKHQLIKEQQCFPNEKAIIEKEEIEEVTAILPKSERGKVEYAFTQSKKKKHEESQKSSVPLSLEEISEQNSNMLKQDLLANINPFDRQYLSDPLQVPHFASEIFTHLLSYQVSIYLTSIFQNWLKEYLFSSKIFLFCS